MHPPSTRPHPTTSTQSPTHHIWVTCRLRPGHPRINCQIALSSLCHENHTCPHHTHHTLASCIHIPGVTASSASTPALGMHFHSHLSYTVLDLRQREEPLPQEVCGCRLMPFIHLCDPDDLNLSIPSQVHLPFVKFVQAWRPQKKEGVLLLLCTPRPPCMQCVCGCGCWGRSLCGVVSLVAPTLGRVCDVLNPHTQSVGTEPPCALRFCVYSPSLACHHTAAVGISIVTPLPTAGVGRCKASVGWRGCVLVGVPRSLSMLGSMWCWWCGGVVCGPQYGQTARTDR
jgi:hypothetical protein